MSDPMQRPVDPQPVSGEPARKGTSPLVWILLLIALIAFAWYFFNQRGADAPPTAPVDAPSVDIGSEQEAAAAREREAAEARERERAAPAPVAADREAAPAAAIEPEYPPAALRSREEGTVVVLATVDASGNATDVQLEQRSRSRDLDAAALDAVRAAKFEPAIRGGKPTSTTVRVPVDFKLDGR